MGGSGKPGRMILKTTLHLVEEYSAANDTRQGDKPGVGPAKIWKPPNPKWYKVNIDNAIFENWKKAGIGVVIRDEKGEVVTALSKLVNAPLGAVEIEAKAMEAGVVFARDVGIREAEFEGNSLIVCMALQRGEGAPSSIQNVLDGTMELVSGFRSFAFAHVKRQGNVLAHLLAQYAKEIENYVVWLEECPSFLEHACAHDISVVSHSYL